MSFLGGAAVSTEEVHLVPFEPSVCSEQVGISRLQYMGGGETAYSSRNSVVIVLCWEYFWLNRQLAPL